MKTETPIPLPVCETTRQRVLWPGRTAANSGNMEVGVSFFIARCWLSSYTLLVEFLGSIKSVFHQT